MSVDQLISSGLLELYVIGDVSDTEVSQVEQAMAASDIVRQEVLEIEKALEEFAFSHAVPSPITTKSLLLATASYTNRLQNGEVPISPPSLHEDSEISEFSQWLDRADMQEPEEYDSQYGHIINSDAEKTTLIVWLKDGAPDETHTDEYEKFLIVEGTCDIKIGDEVHSLKRGDFLSIPLHVTHSVTVTSSHRCKIILERAAA